jgi:hypothetical protein
VEKKLITNSQPIEKLALLYFCFLIVSIGT